MRELFEESLGKSPLDSNESARVSARPALRKRFYKSAGVAETQDGYAVTLDGKPVRTPAKKPLAAPQRAVAESLAAEWEAQAEVIDPAAMPLTRLANSIIDGVAERTDEVAADIAKYFATDLLLYRAEHPDGLVARQTEHWDPVLGWLADEFGARFILAGGVMHVDQPQASLDASRAQLPFDPWALGAMHVATTLMGSAMLALALAKGQIDVPQAWTAAHVDEDWNLDLWGRDEAVIARRAARLKELEAAAKVLDAMR